MNTDQFTQKEMQDYNDHHSPRRHRRKIVDTGCEICNQAQIQTGDPDSICDDCLNYLKENGVEL